MRFRTLVIAAVVLVLVSTGAFATFLIADQARNEASQEDVELTEQLAVQSNITQSLLSEDDHEPTGYADTITVEHNQTIWNASEQYEYTPENATITFLTDADGPANVTYSYTIPENDEGDSLLQSLTTRTGLLYRVGGVFALIMVFLFVGAFTARRIRSNTGRQRGR